MLKGGVIMDVTTAEEARIAEEAGGTLPVCKYCSPQIPIDSAWCTWLPVCDCPTHIQSIWPCSAVPYQVPLFLA